PEDLREGSESFLGAVGIRRKPEVERDDRRLVRAQRIDRLLPVAGAHDLIAVISPFELPLQTLVVLDDKQHFCLFAHAIFRSGSAPASPAGRVMVKVVPRPGRLSTSSRPPMAMISARASNAPTPNPPDLVEANGWKR